MKTIYVSLKSIEKNIKLYLIFLKKILKQLQINSRIINLPTKKKRISLLKSPHVNKKAIEHFEIKKYKTVLCLKLLNTEKEFYFYKFLILNKPKFIKISIRKII
jgi:ribosomal protein S10